MKQRESNEINSTVIQRKCLWKEGESEQKKKTQPLCKKSVYTELFGSAFGKYRKNADQNNSEYEHFLRSEQITNYFVATNNTLNIIGKHFLLLLFHRIKSAMLLLRVPSSVSLLSSKKRRISSPSSNNSNSNHYNSWNCLLVFVR